MHRTLRTGSGEGSGGGSKHGSATADEDKAISDSLHSGLSAADFASSGDAGPPPSVLAGRSGIGSYSNSRGASKASGRSRLSHDGNQVVPGDRQYATNIRHRRVRKGGTFSSYEASCYEPMIRKSWELLKIRANVIGKTLGVILYNHLFDKNTDLHHMFDKTEEEMGEKFLLVFEDIVAAVEDPVAINKKLKSLAPMHLRKGVKPEHTERMKVALYTTLQQVLGDDYTAEVKAAWEWLWSWLSQEMQQSLEDATNEATVLTYSWDLALDNNTEEEMGELLYDTLFELAPNLKPVYRKPRQILSAKFVEMMAALVSFQGDPMRMEEQITWLGFRHIKYGAKREHAKVLGDVLVETMARAVESNWTMDMADAWQELWTDACSMMMSVIDQATKYGFTVQDMWDMVQERTTEAKFGSTLRKLLLSGTEWVSSLSYGILESCTPAKAEAIQSTSDFKAPLSKMALKANGEKEAAEVNTKNPKFPQDDGVVEKSSESDAIGRYFWVMLTELLNLLWDPEKQNERLIVMTTKLFEWGIRSKHLDTIGEAIGEACRRTLKADWSKHMESGWTWWWSVASKQMAKTLFVCEHDHCRIIKESWNKCKERRSSFQLGESFFVELARMAPHIMHLFKRPKVIQAEQFVAVVDALVSFVENPEVFFEGFKALTIRHIKYGVKAEYAKAFGKSIMIGIEKTLEDDFDLETREVWAMLWMRASSCVSRALNVGTNPVIVSLVQGEVDKMRHAINCAERGLRFEWLTGVDINGELISPIYWSLKDGNTPMVRFILSDLLKIRADREMYYYGREVLFSVHPDIVEKLCQQCPEVLLDTLLAGLMWHSKEVENGYIAVNYYIKELYGDPKEEPNVWKQAMAALVEYGRAEMFDHPVAKRLLQVKWERFGKGYLLWLLGVHLVILAMFMVGSVENRENCAFMPLRYLTGVVSLLVLLAQIAVCARHVKEGLFSPCFLCLGLKVPSWMSDTCNLVRMVALLLIVIASFQSCGMLQYDDGSVREIVVSACHSFASLLLWFQVLQVLVLSTRLAAITFTLGRLAEQIFYNMVVVAIFVGAFATALTALQQEHFESFGSSIIFLVRVALNTQVPEMSEGFDPLGLFFMFGFCIVAVIGILNILIVQILSQFSIVARSTQSYALQHCAYICIQMESVMTLGKRNKLFYEMHFEIPVPFDHGDAGPSGGIQVIEPASVRNSSYYQPDRVLRYTGDSSPSDPWPSLSLEEDALLGAAVENLVDQGGDMVPMAL
uniref:Globin domain-containing protein n=1 Tax=Hemiselmis andersenii TaxID=464988 RepID=A0A6U4YXK8_HEMAN